MQDRTQHQKKPLIAVPMGDPAGIGSEILVKAAADPEVFRRADIVAVGDARILQMAVDLTDSALRIRRIRTPSEGSYLPGVLNVIETGCIDIRLFQYGKVSAMCGQAAYAYIEKCIRLALSGEVDAIATTPINKESLKEARIPYIGHTEIFGSLTGTKDPLTMFEVRGMRIFFLSRHVSLHRACDMVTKERIVDYVQRCTEMLSSLGVKQGTMAIAGLNPHSGEHGLFGFEETEEIVPAVAELKAMGFRVEGPVGADSVFYLALQGRYNSVLSLYHDQGHIAAKTLDFERTISITGGMPILRTSVDHGTAFDIAGKNLASPVSMKEAILIAAQYAPKFRTTIDE